MPVKNSSFNLPHTLLLAIAVAATVSSTFRYKLDRNIARPWRNYMRNLDDYKRFQTQEEFYDFLKDFGTGVFRMFTYESDLFLSQLFLDIHLIKTLYQEDSQFPLKQQALNTTEISA